jgi:type II secretory pathway predicted ATPase ExeA
VTGHLKKIDEKQLQTIFLWRVNRKVNKTGLVSVHGLDFEVDSHLGKILEELRMFTNFKIDSQCPMNLVLMGQPELNKIIRLNSMKALYQRINCRYHITGLDESEIKEYMAHHLQVAGRSDNLFANEVISEIFQQAQGIPRMINNLCYECLLETVKLNKSIVDLPTLESVLNNLDIP